MEKILISGANGFIGRNLIKELKDHDVKIYSIVRNKNSELYNIDKYSRVYYCNLMDISNLPFIIKERDFDVFYHLAWMGSSSKERSNYNKQLLNIRYSIDTAKVAKEIGTKKFIGVGTITERISENLFSYNCFSENMIYGIAKETTHKMLRVIAKKISLNFIWAQLSNVYGEDNNTGNIINYTLSKLKNREKPTFSKAETYYDFVHIDDVVKALVLLGSCELKNEKYFIGSGEPRKLKEYLYKIKELINNDIELGIGERKDDGLEYKKEWFNIDNLIEDTGFIPSRSFEENIKRIINSSSF